MVQMAFLNGQSFEWGYDRCSGSCDLTFQSKFLEKKKTKPKKKKPQKKKKTPEVDLQRG